VRVKLRRSVRLGKCVFIVEGRSSSVISLIILSLNVPKKNDNLTFLYTYFSSAGLGFLLGSRLFTLLHAPYLHKNRVNFRATSDKIMHALIIIMIVSNYKVLKVSIESQRSQDVNLTLRS
jgi:hypothetical protein